MEITGASSKLAQITRSRGLRMFVAKGYLDAQPI